VDVHTAVDLSSIEIKDVLASVFLLCTEVESLMMKHGNVQGTLKMQDRKKRKTMTIMLAMLLMFI